MILKAAACLRDSRDKERHLLDVALLLTVVEDPYAECEQWRTNGQAAPRIHSA